MVKYFAGVHIDSVCEPPEKYSLGMPMTTNSVSSDILLWPVKFYNVVNLRILYTLSVRIFAKKISKHFACLVVSAGKCKQRIFLESYCHEFSLNSEV